MIFKIENFQYIKRRAETTVQITPEVYPEQADAILQTSSVVRLA
jgi:hypothetical protein